ncbi:MAG: hypothetical protein DRN04_02495 [Thermoprotei archaeon]|nr:MAG: hypothetical protein DRN04_02495 [Thermoprotei archaeon]
MNLDFCVTTNRGLEDITAKELLKLLPSASNIRIGKSKVFFSADEKAIYIVNLLARTVHRLLWILGEDRCRTLSEIYRYTCSLDFTEVIDRNQSFAVRAERSGKHNFTSIDIAATVGQAIIDSFRRDTGVRLKVNLKNPDVEFFCYLVDNEFTIAVNTTGDSLHKRNYRIYDHPAAIKTTIASALVYLSGWTKDHVFLDPMCGGGTIPIEAALIARNIAPGIFRKTSFSFEKLMSFDRSKYAKLLDIIEKSSNRGKYSIYAIEISPKHLRGAIANAKSAGVRNTIKFIQGDARHLEKYLDVSPEYVVVNPPYGVKLTRREYIPILYKEFLKSLKSLVDHCTLVVITAAFKEFEKACNLLNAEIIEKRRVLHGALTTQVYKCII